MSSQFVIPDIHSDDEDFQEVDSDEEDDRRSHSQDIHEDRTRVIDTYDGVPRTQCVSDKGICVQCLTIISSTLEILMTVART